MGYCLIRLSYVFVSCQGAPGATGLVGAQGVNGSEVSD